MAITVEAGSELTEHRLTPTVETALFRVAQEALANAQRHSGATSVEVRLSARAWGTPGGAVALTVRDDGRGLPGHLAAPPGEYDGDGPALGVGLLGMAERMRQLGGGLAIGPGRPGGTVVEAVVPVAPPTGGTLPPVPPEAAGLP
jgi:signal transduction histidine kinase